MNVLFVSQCSKRALIETRRILDQFAERKGSRVWQTPITMQGLLTIKRMLRKTARRNTAVICHWIKAGNRTELLWVVGNASLFNEAGTVPTNATRRDILRIKDENLWHSIETIGLISSIAGLFHDFGKTNLKFQNMIDPPKKRNKNDKHKADPYRHEWVSLRLFQSFVGELSDREWLEKMRDLKKSDDQEILKKLKCDGLAKTDNPFKNMPPLAKIIGWLIVSHHRLPQWPPIKKIIKNEQEPQIGRIDKWLYDTKFDSAWNSTACINTDLSERDFLSIVKKVWTIKKGGLPFASSVWRRRAQRLSVLSLKNPDMINGTTDWLQKPFVMHLCRMLLMLSDHIYSSKEAQQKWQDKKYSIYANTSKGEKKQKLDEHLVGVSRDSMYFSRVLSNINHKGFPVLRNHKGFQKRNTDPRFRWQDRAYDLACSIRERSYEHGFFGVNMASTGCGKTFANGRIMYGLSNKHTGCRFNVALGLRTLTLQTGEALKQRLSLQDNDIGVLIGSRAAQKIYDFQEETKDIESSESESSKSLFEPDHYIRYEGALDNGPLGKYLRQKSDLHQLVSAPILVSTIDYLVPATESERAGKQIGPMLRLLTSDLVLDEPDDFGVDDLPALCRLVNWAGLLGSKVLISSATLPPSLIKALFDAYLSGRREFQSGWGEPGNAVDICCAWFDEDQNVQKNYGDTPGYMQEHEAFVKKRVARLQKMVPQRKSMIIPISVDEPDSMKAVKAIAMKIHENQYALHDAHGQVNATKDKKISFGLIRMANINPLVAVAKEMLTLAPPSDFHVHYCVYHSRHPLAVRSVIEKRLDSMLDRKDQQKIWSHPEIKKALSEHPETNHLFVVFATSVAEVGRDHDYDWAIVEPSSMRSLIQLAGRLLRHRKIFPTSPNLLILSQNYRSLSQNKNPDQPTIIAFEKPGFETTDFEGKFELSSHDVQNLLNKEQYESINAIPRILENPSLMPSKNLVDLEHAHLEAKLSGDGTKGKPYAALWWKHNAHWCFELQRRTRFRKPEAPDIEYLLYFRDEGETPVFHRYNDQGEPVVCENEFERVELEQPSKGISLWWKDELPEIILSLTESLDMEIETACRHFAVLRLKDESENPQWQYHPALGVFRQLD